MMELIGPAAHRFCALMALHLWQTTLVLAVLFSLGRALRRASGRTQSVFWSVTLWKVLLPLPLLGAIGAFLLDPFLSRRVLTEPMAESVATLRVVFDPTASTSFGRGSAGATPPSLEVALFLFWSLIVSWLCFRSTRHFRTHALRTGSDPHFLGPEAQARLATILESAGIPQDRVVITREGGMPFAYGILKPRIILPAPLIACLDDHELRSILTHEDAHCRRRDPLRGAIERIAFSLFFFYPPLWWILRQLRRSAEFDCDQRATQTTGDPGSFSSALAKALALALPQSPSHAALDLRWPGLLRERLHRIDNMERYNTMKTQRAIILAAVLVVLASSFFAIPVSGGDPQILAPAVMNSQAPETGVEAPMLVQGDVVPPALLDRTPPEYPKDARAGKAEGKVILQAVIEKDGTLSSVTHLRDIACYPSLGQAAEIAVGKWRYNPATLNGAPVRVYFTIVMEFSLGTPPEIPALLELNPVARPVDLSFNAVPLAKVFDALSEASGIKFRIDRSVPADTLVSICRTGSPLKSQLEKLASEWKLRYEVMDASTLRVLAAN